MGVSGWTTAYFSRRGGKSKECFVDVVREQGFDGLGRIGLRQLGEHVAQVGIGVQTIGLGRFDETVEIRARFGTADGVAEQPVLALMKTFS